MPRVGQRPTTSMTKRAPNGLIGLLLLAWPLWQEQATGESPGLWLTYAGTLLLGALFAIVAIGSGKWIPGRSLLGWSCVGGALSEFLFLAVQPGPITAGAAGGAIGDGLALGSITGLGLAGAAYFLRGGPFWGTPLPVPTDASSQSTGGLAPFA